MKDAGVMVMPRPVVQYDVQNETEFRRSVERAVLQVGNAISTDAAIVDVMATFSNLGVASITVVGNQFTKSIKCAVSVTAYPVMADVTAASATDNVRADLTFAGPYVMGSTLYVSAVAYTGTGGSGAASTKFDIKFVVSEAKSTLLVTIAQTASTGFSDPAAATYPTCTLTMTVSDPAGLLIGNALCTIVYQGIQALYNNTLAAAAVTFNATIGATYTFTATLNKALNGGGFAKFTCTKAGGYSGYATWWSSSAWADAPADVIVTILSNTSSSDVTAKAQLTVNTADNVDTIKWKASTSAFPTKADTVATGTALAAGPPFLVSDLGVNLALGNTVYVTVVCYDYSAVLMDKTFYGKATRDSLSKSKTLQWAASGYFHAYTVAQSGDIITSWPKTCDRSLDELFVNFVGPGTGTCFGGTVIATLNHSFVLADGGTVTGASAEVMSQTGANSTTAVVISIYAVAIGSSVGASAAIATLTATATGAYQTVSTTLSQSTTGKRFVVKAALSANPLCETDSYFAKFRSFTCTYLPGDLQSTI